MRNKVVFLIAFLILIGSLSACGASDNSNTGTTSTSSPSSSSAKAKGTPAPTNKHFRVGDVAKVGNTWQVTINSVKTSKGDDINKPQKGEYLMLDVTAKNISNKEQNIFSFASFQLTDNTGMAYTETVNTNVPNPPDGKVKAGAPSRGTFTFDVPTGVKRFTFAFTPDMLSEEGQTIWDIKP